MTVIAHEGLGSFYFGARAVLLSDHDHETASEWASSHIVKNPAYSWILGAFVEAEKPNNNKQFFSTAGLQMGKPSILYAPMNINHHPNRVVGCFAAAELLYPKDAESASQANPYIESLAALWRYYYPDAYEMIKAAQAEESLFYSMECVPRAISTIGGTDDTKEYKYEGRVSPNYPKEINDRQVDGIHLIDPHFVGGALIIPPERPGWSNAEIKQVSSLMKEQWEKMEATCAAVKDDSPNLPEDKVEWIASKLVERSLNAPTHVQADNRKLMADAGFSMPDGSFPILNKHDVGVAVGCVDRAADVNATQAFIIDRASKLGASDLIPDNWPKN